MSANKKNVKVLPISYGKATELVVEALRDNPRPRGMSINMILAYLRDKYSESQLNITRDAIRDAVIHMAVYEQNNIVKIGRHNYSLQIN